MTNHNILKKPEEGLGGGTPSQKLYYKNTIQKLNNMTKFNKNKKMEAARASNHELKARGRGRKFTQQPTTSNDAHSQLEAQGDHFPQGKDKTASTNTELNHESKKWQQIDLFDYTIPTLNQLRKAAGLPERQ